jgi:hypothetical protein
MTATVQLQKKKRKEKKSLVVNLKGFGDKTN